MKKQCQGYQRLCLSLRRKEPGSSGGSYDDDEADDDAPTKSRVSISEVAAHIREYAHPLAIFSIFSGRCLVDVTECAVAVAVAVVYSILVDVHVVDVGAVVFPSPRLRLPSSSGRLGRLISISHPISHSNSFDSTLGSNLTYRLCKPFPSLPFHHKCHLLLHTRELIYQIESQS